MFVRFFGFDAFLGNSTCHADELLLIFNSHELPIDGSYTEDDKKVTKKLLEMWTNFVKSSDPTPITKIWKR